MSLRKRGKNWWYDFSIKKTRFRGSTLTENKKLAEEYLTQLKSDIYAQLCLGKKKKPTWYAIIDYYTDNKGKTLSVNSNNGLNSFVKHFIKCVDINKQVNQEDINVFIDSLKKTNLSDSTILTNISFFKAIVNYAYKNQKLDNNFIFNTDNLSFGKRNTVISIQEFNTLLRVTNNIDYYNMWILLLNTGCRIEELLKLAKDRVFLDVDTPYFYLPAELTKTKKERYVPLFNDAKNSLEYLMQQSNGNKAISLTYAQIIYNLKKYSKLADITTKITPHTFRHSFITWATKGDLPFLNGAPMNPQMLKLMVGHSKNSNITELYTHLNYKDIVDSISKTK